MPCTANKAYWAPTRANAGATDEAAIPRNVIKFNFYVPQSPAFTVLWRSLGGHFLRNRAARNGAIRRKSFAPPPTAIQPLEVSIVLEWAGSDRSWAVSGYMQTSHIDLCTQVWNGTAAVFCQAAATITCISNFEVDCFCHMFVAAFSLRRECFITERLRCSCNFLF